MPPKRSATHPRSSNAVSNPFHWNDFATRWEVWKELPPDTDLPRNTFRRGNLGEPAARRFELRKEFLPAISAVATVSAAITTSIAAASTAAASAATATTAI